MKCYISSSCSSKKTPSNVLQELTNIGFRRIELTGNIKYCNGIKDEIIRWRESYGLEFLIHNYLPIQSGDFVLNLASKDPEIKRRTLNLIKSVIGLSKELGINLYSLHPGFKHDLITEKKEGFFVKNNEDCNKREDFYQTLKSVQFTVGNNFKIAIENLSPKAPDDIYSYLCTPNDIKEFLGHFDNMTNIGILLDLGHLNVASNLLNFDKYEILNWLFSNCGGRIFEIHISENDGSKDLHRISELDSWQIKFLIEHRKYLKDIPLVLEWHNTPYGDAFKRYKMIAGLLEDGEERFESHTN